MIDTFSIRCGVLRLAFSGKLTEQRKADGNARSLLSRISAKKNIEQTENTPYEIPDTWAWVKLADLFTINPKVEADDATEAAFIPMESVNAGFDRTFSFERQSWVQASKNHTKFSDGDVAFAKISPCFENRKSFIAHGLPNGIGGGTTELIVLRQSEMLPEYTYYLVLDQRFIGSGKASYKGTVGQQRVQSDVIKNYFVPVPPLAEQQRIVDRIEQAFSLLDTIDALQEQYSDNLTVLKSKLIDAAIQGKLTEQLPEDGTAEELYQQIQTERQALINAGKIKKEKPLPEISADEIPHAIPENWKWCRVGMVSSQITDGEHKTPRRVSSFCGYYLLSARNVTNNSIKLDDVDYVDEEEYNILSKRCNPKRNDVLISCSGSIGRCCVVEDDNKYVMVRSAAMVSLIKVHPKWIMYCIHSNALQKQISDKAKATAQANLFQEPIKRLIIPIPPLAEQQRIVTRLDEVLIIVES